MNKADDQLLEKDALTTQPGAWFWLGIVAAALTGILGSLAGAYAGSWIDILFLDDGGLLTVVCALGGFVVGFVIAFVVGPPMKYFIRQLSDTVAMPERARQTQYGSLDRTFELYVTVHRVQNLITEGARRSFIEVTLGRFVHGRVKPESNYPKRTCIGTEYEEVFHFAVSPKDDTIRIGFLTQEVHGDVLWGYHDLNITEQVLGKGFPQRIGYKLNATVGDVDPDDVADNDVGSVIVSFAPGTDLPPEVRTKLAKANPFEYERNKETQDRLVHDARKDKSYGTWLTKTSYGP